MPSFNWCIISWLRYWHSLNLLRRFVIQPFCYFHNSLKNHLSSFKDTLWKLDSHDDLSIQRLKTKWSITYLMMITTIEARYVLGDGAYWSLSGKDKFKDKKKVLWEWKKKNQWHVWLTNLAFASSLDNCFEIIH